MTVRQALERRGVTLTSKLVFRSVTPCDAETIMLLRTHKDALLRDLAAPDTLDRLPWQLRGLIKAATSNVLPAGAVPLPRGLVHDLNRYVMAWGCSYLTGDPAEALKRLWEVYDIWQRALSLSSETLSS